MTLPALPDAEAACITWLAARSSVTALAGQRISTRFDDTLPCVTIRRTGGVPVVRQMLDAPHIEFAAWASDEEDAAELAQVVRAALHDMAGHQAGSAWVSGVDDDQGIASLPDDSADPTVARYVGGVVVYMRPFTVTGS